LIGFIDCYRAGGFLLVFAMSQQMQRSRLIALDKTSIYLGWGAQTI
jgi:hypothetical protein